MCPDAGMVRLSYEGEQIVTFYFKAQTFKQPLTTAARFRPGLRFIDELFWLIWMQVA
jgi:hypothetical protein